MSSSWDKTTWNCTPHPQISTFGGFEGPGGLRGLMGLRDGELPGNQLLSQGLDPASSCLDLKSRDGLGWAGLGSVVSAAATGHYVRV